MDDMKDSGIPWLGEIPAEWEVSKIKYIFQCLLGKMVEINNQDLETNDSYLCAANIKWSGIDTSIRRRMFFNKSEKKRYLLKKNDVLIMEGGATSGTACIYREEFSPCYMQNSIVRCRAKYNQDYRYLYYWLHITFGCGYIDAICNQATFRHFTKEKVENTPIPFISFSEQRCITDFLDEKCGEIDGIVVKIQQEMETLKQYKQSIISEAVTKGISPNVPMKDSHVEWIKKIPKTWEISKFKYLCQIKSNLVTPEQYKELPQISPDNIEKDSGKLLTYCTVEESGIISGNHLFTEGQILYSKIRPNLNKVTIAPFDGLCSADMYPIETKNPKFVLYMMLSKYFVDQVSIIIRDRVKMPKINQEELGRIRIAVPPLEEQREIAAYLDQKCAAIDAIISSKEEQLQTLASYKKSLIYEYVTGKKRVPTA